MRCGTLAEAVEAVPEGDQEPELVGADHEPPRAPDDCEGEVVPRGVPVVVLVGAGQEPPSAKVVEAAAEGDEELELAGVDPVVVVHAGNH